MRAVILCLMMLCATVWAQSPLEYLQSAHPTAVAECRVPQGEALTTMKLAFHCVEAIPTGELKEFYLNIPKKKLPPEWPPLHAISTRTHLYLTREDDSLKFLSTRPRPCEPGYAPHGVMGQMDTQMCEGLLFPAWEKKRLHSSESQ